MNITMLASLHVPFDTRIFQKEAISLNNAGHKVTIIVPHTKNETINEIKISHVPIPKSGKERLTKTLFLIFRKALNENKNNVIHFHDSELIIYAILLKLLGRKVIYDAHEDTPRQIMYQHWIPPLLKKPIAILYYLLEKIGGKLFDKIIIAEPIIGRYFPKKKTILIRNFALIEEQKVINKTPYKNRQNIITYIGGITKARGAEIMVNAVAKVNNSVNFKLCLGGTFHPKNLKEKLEKLNGWECTNYIGWVSRQEVANILNSSKIGIIIPQPNKRYTTNYPVKLFEYMEAGLPVIASNEGIAKEFVMEANCGLLVNPNDTDEIAKSIEYLFNNPKEAEEMGKRGKNLINTKYNWVSEEEKLIDLYKEI